MTSKIIKISLIVSILSLLSGCGVSNQERIMQEKIEQEKVKQRKNEQEKARQIKIEQEKIEQEKAKQRKIEQEKIEQEKVKQIKIEQEKQSATMVSLGYGNTQEEALKNAFSTAVGEYVGVLVDAKEVTTNGKLIEDKILTFSNGYIDNYKIISSREQMGLWEVKISALIKQQQVLSEIKKLNIEAVNIEDSKNRYAKIISQVKSKFDAEEIFVKLSNELMSVETFRKYINLKITGIDINENEATRKYVPVYIKHKIFFTWTEYDKITNKIENIYKQLGGKLIRSEIVDFNSMTKPIGCCEIYPYDKNKFTSIFVVVRKNNELFLNVWKFPKNYEVIYPFQDRDYWHWTEYRQDEQKITIPNEAYGYQLYNILFLDQSKNIIFSKNDLKINDEQGWVYGSYYQIIRFAMYDERRIILPSTTSSVNNGKTNTKNDTVYFDGTIKVDVPIEYINDLKQIKIEWQNKK